MANIPLPKANSDLAAKRHALSPGIDDAFAALSKAVSADGALDKRTQQPIGVAVAHVTQRPWCIEGHTRGATNEQIMEAIRAAAEMRAVTAHAHANKTLAVLDEIDGT